MPHLKIDPVERPWNNASAIFFTIMKEHAKLDRDMFAVGNWVINADTLKTISPSVDFSEVQARFSDA